VVQTRALLFLLFTLICSSSFASSYVSVNKDSPVIDALGTDLFRQSNSTGMLLVLVHSDTVIFRVFGQTAPNSHQLPNDQSLIRLASLTKVFTADMLNKLVIDKAVRLGDPLQRYAPAGIMVPTRVRPITLLDLATHTSGLPREIGNAPPGPHFTFPDYRTRWNWLPNQHLRSIPGTAALYSNVAFDFLADALQSATHESYPRLLAERTLNPLRMYSTTFYPNAEQCRHLLASAFDDGPCASTEATDGSSGLYSTAADIAIWLKYLLRTGGPVVPLQDPKAQDVYIRPSS
jgi:D-alanyl-D-alanine-carboxypeptidase/D-alanyl-D-alanine-endopeptidase